MIGKRLSGLLPLLLLAGCGERAETANVVLPLDGEIKPVLVLSATDQAASGPVLGYDGSLYFSLRNNIQIVNPNGRHRMWARSVAPRGHKVLADGLHIICDPARPGVLRLTSLGERIGRVLKTSGGAPLQGPLDVFVDQWNGFYFSDPGVSAKAFPTGAIHYVQPDGDASLVLNGLAAPTGLALSADWRRLYVIESASNRVLSYDVTGQGRLSGMRVFATLPDDKPGAVETRFGGGLSFDLAGNLYVANQESDAVVVLDPQGKRIREYQFGKPTTGLCFGGPKMDQLFVTTADPSALYRLNLGVRGVDLRPRR